MIKALSTDEFLALIQQEDAVVVDVRTPLEYSKGYIPGAINLPLFSDEERVIVGTVYKEKGQQPAILKGLELVGPRLKGLTEQAAGLAQNNTLILHCWRGGLRSSSVAWLLNLYGLNVMTLRGGYKFFRRAVLSAPDLQRNYLILGGRTGSGKTEILNHLARCGEQVIDLEQLARHKGSSFGSIGEKPAISQEQFENELGLALLKTDPGKRIWLEDESRTIGKKVLPVKLWEQMQAAHVKCIELPFEVRIDYLLGIYGGYDKKELEEALLRISRRLGGMQTKEALQALQEGDLRTTCGICLRYYDKTYDHGMSKREPHTVERFSARVFDPSGIAGALVK